MDLVLLHLIDNSKRNVFWAAKQHIRMISEVSCDTEDCSNDAENSALNTAINYILKYIPLEKSNFYDILFWSNKS